MDGRILPGGAVSGVSWYDLTRLPLVFIMVGTRQLAMSCHAASASDLRVLTRAMTALPLVCLTLNSGWNWVEAETERQFSVAGHSRPLWWSLHKYIHTYLFGWPHPDAWSPMPRRTQGQPRGPTSYSRGMC